MVSLGSPPGRKSERSATLAALTGPVAAVDPVGAERPKLPLVVAARGMVAAGAPTPPAGLAAEIPRRVAAEPPSPAEAA